MAVANDTLLYALPPNPEADGNSNSEVASQPPGTSIFEDVFSTLDWFRGTFNSVASADKNTIGLAEWETALNTQGFAENLFKLFDIDCSGGITLQELIGGLTRIPEKMNQRKKELKWFKKTFSSFAGDDDILQVDEFKSALTVKMFAEHLFRLFDHHKSGKLSVTELLNSLEKLTVLNRDSKWLAWFEDLFTEIAGEEKEISFDAFKTALKPATKDSFFARRFFELFDEDNNGKLSLVELINGVTRLTHGSEKEKLKFLFDVYDADGNGYIDYSELRTVLVSCMTESRLSFSDEKIDELTDILFKDTDDDNSGTITFDELYAELSKYPEVIKNLTLSAANWLKGPPQNRRRKFFKSFHPMEFFLDNLTLIMYLVIYTTINTVLFVEAAYRYRNGGVLVAIARGCGQCLNFNAVLILILMMRQVITKIRGTFLSHFLPLDHYIELHKLTGYMIVFFSILHMLAHVANFTHLDLTDELENITAWESLFSIHTPFGWVGGAAGLTGWILTITLLIIFLCALPCVRRKGFFEVFYWTHNLFVIWYIVLILHGPNFWYWFIGPAVVYISERILRSRVFKLAQYGRTYVEEGIILPSNVIQLVITRPPNFKYRPGDYIFVNIPKIAKYEWHPFTISSAPEQKAVIWLHVRVVGTWTKKLYELYEQKDVFQGKNYSERLSAHRKSLRSKNHESCRDANDQHTAINMSTTDQPGIEIFIDGPYGTPSVHIFEAEHAVLIGAGIGVTPFASILQSIAAKHRNAKHTCPSCSHEWVERISQDLMNLRKVDFFWINRDQRSFEWFLTLLSQLENEKIGGDTFLKLHMYMTSALRRTDMKAIGLHIALDLIHERQHRDLITGLQTRTLAGRPDWDEAFKKIKLENTSKRRVTVFFCGPMALGTVLRKKCQKYGFRFRKENF